MRKSILTIPLILVAALSGFVLFRSVTPSKPGAEFDAYVLKAYQDKVYDDGRVEHQFRFTIYTASDGSVREVRTPINPDGTEGDNVIEQIVKAHSGTYLIFHKNKVVSTLRRSPDPIVKVTREEYQAMDGYKYSEDLFGKFRGYCVKVTDEHGSTEKWKAPEFGIVVLGYRFNPVGASYTIVRWTTDVSPGDDRNVYANYEGYKWDSLETAFQ